MKIDLAGKKALITGGASGIGKACAQTLAEAGAQIAIVDINLAGAQETVASLGGQGLALKCDLSSAEDVAAMCQQVNAAWGGVDILVNCAGIIAYKRGVNGITIEEWDKVLSVNLRGTFLVCRGFIEGMKERKYGKIINFSSMAAQVGGIEVGLHYSTAKAGLIGFTRTVAKEGGPCGVCVNAVAPGFIMTDPVKKQLSGREDPLSKTIPLQRLGEAQDVANVVLFLASPLSDYITGSTIDINGGLYMG
jgi:3-oxoacyl-[acyl-carrier protein] reductase